MVGGRTVNKLVDYRMKWQGWQVCKYNNNNNNNNNISNNKTNNDTWLQMSIETQQAGTSLITNYSLVCANSEGRKEMFYLTTH